MKDVPLLRLPFVAAALLALLAALWAGLVRLGWQLPPLQPGWVANHGPLMISAFLGTVIGLERAVALSALLGARWAYAAPLFAGLGGAAILIGLPNPVGRALIALGSVCLCAIFVFINRRSPNWPHAVMGAGALLWLIGNGLWLSGQSVYRVAPWWAGFLVLTIAGERLELARVLILKRAALITFLVCNAVFLAGLSLSLFAFGPGVRVSGAGLISLGVWLLGYDLARKTVRQNGLTRFIAACLLLGYGWLIVSGVLWLWRAEVFSAGPLYDAMLHTLLLGFVFSMIFGHAPLILPAVTHAAIPYRSAFYAHLGLLHFSLLLRVVGSLAAWPGPRQWGGMLNVIALLLFIGNLIRAARIGRAPSTLSDN
jgi:hypothetical protein